MALQPYYQDAQTTLYLGDCRDVLAAVVLPKIDLLMADPPYGVAWAADSQRFAANKPRGYGRRYPPLVGDDGPFDPRPWLRYPQVILWGANCYSERLPKGRWLVWDKRFKSGKAFLAHGEAAWMKGGFGIWIYSYVKKSGACPGAETGKHPTQKPVALMQWCLGLAAGKTRRVRTVLDPYCGSGTTLIAAKTRDVQAIGIEIEEQYCETAARRLERTHVEEAA